MCPILAFFYCTFYYFLQYKYMDIYNTVNKQQTKSFLHNIMHYFFFNRMLDTFSVSLLHRGSVCI